MSSDKTTGKILSGSFTLSIIEWNENVYHSEMAGRSEKRDSNHMYAVLQERPNISVSNKLT